MVDLRLAVTGGTSACNSVDGRCAYTDHGGDAGTYHYSIREGTLYHQTASTCVYHVGALFHEQQRGMSL